MLIEIDKGQTVRAVAEALQTVAYDLKSRFVPKYKGKVKTILSCSPDPNDYDSMGKPCNPNPQQERRIPCT